MKRRGRRFYIKTPPLDSRPALRMLGGMPDPRYEGVRWITFDAAGTLIFPYPSVGEVYASVLADEQVAAPAAELETRFLESFRELTARPRARTDEAAEHAFWRAVVAGTVRPWCPEDKLDAVFDGAYTAFSTARCWRTPAAAGPTLEELERRGYRLALLSNADSRFRRVFRELGLARYFRHIFLSSEVGYEKPDPRMFDHAAGVLEADRDEILHVGDSQRHDGEGARQAGWRAAILGSDIQSLAQLTTLLP